MKNRILHNWVLKLTSVVIAVALWVVIYLVTDPAATKRMYNVPVTFVNTEVLTSKDQVYQVLENTDVVRTLTIDSTSSVINDLRESDINVEADFSKMKMDGTIELKIYSNRHNENIVFTPSTKELKLLVEDRIDRYVSLGAQVMGEPAEGYMVASAVPDLNRITVSGAESIVNSISKAMAVVDVADAKSDIFSYADIVLYDGEGKEIDKKKLSMSAKTVSTPVVIYATKTVPIRYEAMGMAAEGFVITGEETSEVMELKIAGKENVLAAISEIVVEGEELLIEGAAEDVVVTVDLDDYLPAGTIRADRQGNGQVAVTLHIAPIIEKEFTLRMGQVQLENVPEGYTAAHVLRSAEYKVVVMGSEHLFEEFDVSGIQATFDVGAWMEAEKIRDVDGETSYWIMPAYEAEEGLSVITSEPVEIVLHVVGEQQ